jgi:hypothetical protein
VGCCEHGNKTLIPCKVGDVLISFSRRTLLYGVGLSCEKCSYLTRAIWGREIQASSIAIARDICEQGRFSIDLYDGRYRVCLDQYDTKSSSALIYIYPTVSKSTRKLPHRSRDSSVV